MSLNPTPHHAPRCTTRGANPHPGFQNLTPHNPRRALKPRKRLRPLVDTACTYDSIQGLIAEVKSSGHKTMATMLKKHVW